MNKEEIIKEIEHIANCELYDTIGVKYLRLNIEKLFEENQQLKERIDKAIEYLEEPNRDSFDYSKALLLEILLGENNE